MRDRQIVRTLQPKPPPEMLQLLAWHVPISCLVTLWHVIAASSTSSMCRCPFVLKPASRTPIGALIIAEILSRAPHLPLGAFSVLPCSREGADLFTTDPRFKLLTFTGSPSVVRPKPYAMNLRTLTQWGLPWGRCDVQSPVSITTSVTRPQAC